MRFSSRHLLVAGIVALSFAAAPARAIVLFQDNFDTDSASTVSNFNSFANWTVGSGTVDYLRSGSIQNINCVGGAGGCVDLDGSTRDGGRMVSNLSFNFLAGESYRLSVDVSGNQRGLSADDITFGIDGFFSNSISGIAFNAPFTTRQFTDSSSSALAGQLFIETSSADNVGVIIDNVVLECVTCVNGQVPEPASLALLGLGLAGLAFSRRKSAS